MSPSQSTLLIIAGMEFPNTVGVKTDNTSSEKSLIRTCSDEYTN